MQQSMPCKPAFVTGCRLLSHLLLVWAWLAAAFSAPAQMVLGLNADSLRQQLALLPDDTVKAVTLIRLGQQYENNQPDSALYYYNLAKELSNRLNYPTGVLMYISNYTAVLNVRGQFEESLKLNLQAVDISRRYGMQLQLVKALMNVGAVYQYREAYAVAADYYLKALPLLEASGEAQYLSFAYGNLCGLYRNLAQPDKALHYAQKALEYAEEINDLPSIGAACNNLGNALKDLKYIQEAVQYMNRAYRIGIRINDMNMKETALINLGAIYLELNRPDKCLSILQTALPMAAYLQDIPGQAAARNGIGVALFRLKRYKDAEQRLEADIPFMRLHAQNETLSQLLLLMSDVQLALGKPLACRSYRDQYDSVRAVLLNEPLLKNVQELETRYGVAKKQNEILRQGVLLEEKSREGRRQRNLLLLSAGGLLLLALLLLLTFRVYRQQQLLDKQTILALQAGQENIRLKAMLEGQQQERQRISEEMHDDMGTGLTSLLFLSRSLKKEEGGAIHKIQHTSEMLLKKMNEIIWMMNQDQDTLDSLAAYTRIQVLEALSHAGISFYFTVVPDPLPEVRLGQEIRRNVYLCVQEAVHNAIRHAAATALTITFTLTEQQLEITVQDNGQGFNAQPAQRFGNGLKNMRQRMHRINGTLDVASAGGVTVWLKVPLHL